MTAKTLSRMVGLLLVAHGLIHLLGPIEIWGLADIEELTGEATIVIGEAAADVLAVGWLAAAALLLVAGAAVIKGRPSWNPLALAGVVVSQAVIVVWWADAATGTIPNLLIIIAVLLSRRRTVGSDNRQPAAV